MFIQIRNFSTLFALTCPISMLMLWPIIITMCNYEILPSEALYQHLGTLFVEETFL